MPIKVIREKDDKQMKEIIGCEVYRKGEANKEQIKCSGLFE
ncbi:MAG TPA: hypothetical protein VL087_01480 [Nitrospirota bacterium]|nr:hypothetical protein [Nitrospirota bacterium]